MSANRRRSNKARGKQAAPQPKQVDFWRPGAALPTEAPITVADDPSATLRSLGPPPLPGQADAQKHIVLVAARASGVATALAAAAELLDFGSQPD